MFSIIPLPLNFVMGLRRQSAQRSMGKKIVGRIFVFGGFRQWTKKRDMNEMNEYIRIYATVVFIP